MTERVATGRIVCVGDVIDDLVVRPRAAIRPDTDTAADIRPRAGGAAANTASWLGALGSAVDFVGVVAEGDRARHEALFREVGVTPHLIGDRELPTGMIVVLVDGESRTMLTERGANARLTPESVHDDLLRGADLLHLTGYSLVDGPRAEGVRDLVDRAHAHRASVSLTAASAGFIADYGVSDFLTAIDGVDLLFANADEAALLTGEQDLRDATRALAERHGSAVVTHGSSSVLVATRGAAPREVPVPPVDGVIDPTGAGDAMAAGYLRGHVGGLDAVRAAELGIATAARAITVAGARPQL